MMIKLGNGRNAAEVKFLMAQPTSSIGGFWGMNRGGDRIDLL